MGALKASRGPCLQSALGQCAHSAPNRTSLGAASLSRTECAALVEHVLKEISDCLERGETVKLSSFGLFVVRKKNQRMGRNPRTGEEVPIAPRRIVLFKPSAILKKRINAPDTDRRETKRNI